MGKIWIMDEEEEQHLTKECIRAAKNRVFLLIRVFLIELEIIVLLWMGYND